MEHWVASDHRRNLGLTATQTVKFGVERIVNSVSCLFNVSSVLHQVLQLNCIPSGNQTWNIPVAYSHGGFAKMDDRMTSQDHWLKGSRAVQVSSSSHGTGAPCLCRFDLGPCFASKNVSPPLQAMEYLGDNRTATAGRSLLLLSWSNTGIRAHLLSQVLRYRKSSGHTGQQTWSLVNKCSDHLDSQNGTRSFCTTECMIDQAIWRFPGIGTPKSSILIGFSIINHPFWAYSHLRKAPYHVLSGSPMQIGESMWGGWLGGFSTGWTSLGMVAWWPNASHALLCSCDWR